jgi:hypothetical protein
MLYVHYTHKTRISDASTFDEICELCGATDRSGSSELSRPCPEAAEDVIQKKFDEIAKKAAKIPIVALKDALDILGNLSNLLGDDDTSDTTITISNEEYTRLKGQYTQSVDESKAAIAVIRTCGKCNKIFPEFSVRSTTTCPACKFKGDIAYLTFQALSLARALDSLRTGQVFARHKDDWRIKCVGGELAYQTVVGALEGDTLIGGLDTIIDEVLSYENEK